MSDILQNAESLCGMFALPLQDDGRPDAQLINLVPGLVEEIKRLRAYVERLEEIISDFYECDATRRGCCRQAAHDQAHAALDRIREGR